MGISALLLLELEAIKMVEQNKRQIQNMHRQLFQLYGLSECSFHGTIVRVPWIFL